MARKLRIEYAGACYHVINRRNYRRDLFGGGPGGGQGLIIDRVDSRQLPAVGPSITFRRWRGAQGEAS